MEHGGDMNGFILLRGDAQKLAAVRVSPELIDIETQSMLASWNKHLSKYSR